MIAILGPGLGLGSSAFLAGTVSAAVKKRKKREEDGRKRKMSIPSNFCRNGLFFGGGCVAFMMVLLEEGFSDVKSMECTKWR